MTLDYINLDDALSAICKQRCGEHHSVYDCESVCEVIETLKSLPVEFLSPVVRCQDCQNRYEYLFCGYMGDNDFCSAGQPRKDGANNATD